MQNTHFNWYPVDPYGQIWRYAYYFDREDINNLQKIEVAEVSCYNKQSWHWKFLKNTLVDSLLSGFSQDRDEAMGVINKMIA
ncbi:MAG: hypothetical protein HOD63_05030 [Bacteroidetes bacterium]|jgi:hypothetical protein|nr:hypothetical protein [Bacteroidota bacterium]MBT5528824.1 hypothetical protein [Cytophagia bacterium]MBT3934990.1 hypothetical protein [Bacteroidota bacterium]MBT4337929.1 hypothetical protein [Bacteroidota bacterium]MBT4729837.1 hypothetical protein [Bacteroidota bacterium]